jgi:nuclear pore complex protein Nup98-Nup96
VLSYLTSSYSQQASFGGSKVPTAPRPPVKIMRIASGDSVMKGSEATFADAGLTYGKSFRVGWGVGSQVVLNGSLAAPGENM